MLSWGQAFHTRPEAQHDKRVQIEPRGARVLCWSGMTDTEHNGSYEKRSTLSF